MFLCCFLTFWAQSERCFCHSRHWCKHCCWHCGPLTWAPSGNRGQPKEGLSKPTGMPLGQPHILYLSFCVCVCVGGGDRKCGMRGAHPGQEQMFRGWKPGGSVFPCQPWEGMADRMGRWVLGTKFLYPLANQEFSSCHLLPPLLEVFVEAPLCQWQCPRGPWCFLAQNLALSV